MTITSQTGHRLPALTPRHELLDLELFAAGNLRDTLQAYQLAKRGNGQRVPWGTRYERNLLTAPTTRPRRGLGGRIRPAGKMAQTIT